MVFQSNIISVIQYSLLTSRIILVFLQKLIGKPQTNAFRITKCNI